MMNPWSVSLSVFSITIIVIIFTISLPYVYDMLKDYFSPSPPIEKDAEEEDDDTIGLARRHESTFITQNFSLRRRLREERQGRESLPIALRKVDPSVLSRITQCSPLSTLEELLNFSAETDTHGRFTIPLNRSRFSNREKSKVLLCHDMKGGYLQDRFLQGGILDENCYQHFHWSHIDLFCYFSHQLVTIPPVPWINCAHRSGVGILGTFITEWESGKSFCRRIFATKESAVHAATKLAEIATCYKLDGWLINIENSLLYDEVTGDEEAETSDNLSTAPSSSMKFKLNLVSNVQIFLCHLTELMHELDDQSTVLWYDSVVSNGQLLWQNTVNDRNISFMNCCDGIFVNYGWNETAPASSAALVGPNRKHEIYFGIDVFGRGTFGGGGFDTSKALVVLKKAGVSAAIFAPGWLLEVGCNPSGDGDDVTEASADTAADLAAQAAAEGGDVYSFKKTYRKFSSRSVRFWNSVSKVWDTDLAIIYRPLKESLSVIFPISNPPELMKIQNVLPHTFHHPFSRPLLTIDFSCATARNYFISGIPFDHPVENNSGYFDLNMESSSDFDISIFHAKKAVDRDIRVEWYTKAAYSGSACVSLNGNLPPKSNVSFIIRSFIHDDDPYRSIAKLDNRKRDSTGFLDLCLTRSDRSNTYDDTGFIMLKESVDLNLRRDGLVLSPYLNESHLNLVQLNELLVISYSVALADEELTDICVRLVFSAEEDQDKLRRASWVKDQIPKDRRFRYGSTEKLHTSSTSEPKFIILRGRRQRDYTKPQSASDVGPTRIEENRSFVIAPDPVKISLYMKSRKTTEGDQRISSVELKRLIQQQSDIVCSNIPWKRRTYVLNPKFIASMKCDKRDLVRIELMCVARKPTDASKRKIAFRGYFDALSISRCPRAVVEGLMKLHRVPYGDGAISNIDCVDLLQKSDNLDAGLSMNYHAGMFKLKTQSDPSSDVFNLLEFSDALFCPKERAIVVNVLVEIRQYHVLFERPRVRDQGDCLLRAHASINVQSHFNWRISGDVFLSPPTIRTLYVFAVLLEDEKEKDEDENIEDFDEATEFSFNIELKTEGRRIHFPLSVLRLTTILRLEETVDHGWRIHRSLSQLILPRKHWTQDLEPLSSVNEIVSGDSEIFDPPVAPVVTTRRKVQRLHSQLLLIEEEDLNTVEKYVSVQQTIHMVITRK